MKCLSKTLALLLAFTSVTACSGGSTDDSGDEASGADAGITAESPDAANGGGGGIEGPTGLAGFCEYYKECGGSYYETAQDCIDASIGYWGECRQAALDSFGECMMAIDCSEWNPDTYNPANTECSEEWSVVRSTPCD